MAPKFVCTLAYLSLVGVGVLLQLVLRWLTELVEDVDHSIIHLIRVESDARMIALVVRSAVVDALFPGFSS